MSALTVIEIVEGISNSLLSYFFDPKEPVLELRPLTGELLNNEFIYDLAETTLKGKKLSARVEDGKFLLYRDVDSRVVVQCHQLQNESAPSRETWDELHRKNTSLLWNFNNEYHNARGTMHFNDLNSATMLTMAIGESQRARLVNFTYRRRKGMVGFKAIFALEHQFTGVELYQFEFCSDSNSWNMVEDGPSHDTNKDCLVFVEYDVMGRISNIVKRDRHQVERVLCGMSIAYSTIDMMPRYAGELGTIRRIPKSLWEHLVIKRVVTEHAGINNKTGNTFYTYACLLEDMTPVHITITH